MASIERLQLAQEERREVPEADFWRIGILWKFLSEQLLANYASDVENQERLEGAVFLPCLELVVFLICAQFPHECDDNE